MTQVLSNRQSGSSTASNVCFCICELHLCICIMTKVLSNRQSGSPTPRWRCVSLLLLCLSPHHTKRNTTLMLIKQTCYDRVLAHAEIWEERRLQKSQQCFQMSHSLIVRHMIYYMKDYKVMKKRVCFLKKWAILGGHDSGFQGSIKVLLKKMNAVKAFCQLRPFHKTSPLPFQIISLPILISSS